MVLDPENNQVVGFISERIISLKSTPLDMCLDCRSDKLIISSDKQCWVYRVSAGDLVCSYKTGDNGYYGISASGGNVDAVNLGTISLGFLSDKIYLAGMGSDKSVRLYEHPTGTVIGSGWGHSEGISGLTWVYTGDGATMLASSGNDGTIFLWDITVDAHTSSTTSLPTPGSPNRVSPTRKILSKAELSKFIPNHQIMRATKSPSPGRKSIVSSLSARNPSPISNQSSGSSTAILPAKTPTKTLSASRMTGSSVTQNLSNTTSDSNSAGSPIRSGARYGNSFPPTKQNVFPPIKQREAIGSRLRQSMVPRVSTNLGPGRRTLSSSKSVPMLAPKKEKPSIPIEKSAVPDESIQDLRKTLSSFRSRYTRDVINYEKQNKSQLRLLCQELKDTLTLIDPSSDRSTTGSGPNKALPRSRSSTMSLSTSVSSSSLASIKDNTLPDMQEILQQFGDRLISLVDSKLGNVPNPSNSNSLDPDFFQLADSLKRTEISTTASEHNNV
ncbi:hypothetical protein AWJ20_2903 [Sugiyamaella lignohabitans]|uniref:Uncharacterized protein n=1 Tax=Sugiyamaella lignohabitans TaxID=796027 RepID=A0A161HMV1_9ASCO|nr:uncharacterized protein AWJ20_2903 [Sugiyamaella lignohabitans]ANB15277.1 hypothetical protein AWJ20_2903 [Sugiyamaella lignohabitans]